METSYEIGFFNCIEFNVRFDLREHPNLIKQIRQLPGVNILHDSDVKRYDFRIIKGELFDAEALALVVQAKIQEYLQSL